MSKLVVLPAPIAPIPDGATIAVDELVLLDGYHTMPTCLLRISTTNRKRFNLEALQRLAANVKEVGILQPILVRPVRPTEEHPQAFEIVAGERRFRSAILAGLAEVPLIVRHLTDLQAAEIQLLENIQREDPHPLEEAEGYQLLMQNHGYDADQLAERVKKSRAYIYGRLKLCALSLDAREVFLDGDISASTALLIARIPVPELQVRALKEILEPYGPKSDPMSYRRARDHIQNIYTLDLTVAPFQLTDAKLLDGVPSCAKCPKRTGNQPEIYADAKSADVCTDPDCYAEKKASHHARTVAQARKRGIPVHEGKEANSKISDYMWDYNSALVVLETPLGKFERVNPTTGMAGSMESRLAPEARPQPTAYVVRENGEAVALFERAAVQAALERAGACETVEANAARLANEQANPEADAQLSQKAQRENEHQAALDAKKAKAAAISAERIALYRQLRQRFASGMSLGALRELVKLMVLDNNCLSLPDDLLGDVYPFKERSDEALCAYIDKADASELQLLLVDLLIGEHLSVDYWAVDDQQEAPGSQALQAMARYEGIFDTEIGAEDAPDESESQSGRPKLHLKAKAELPAEPADGPVIKTKKVRVVPIEAWPFPSSK